MHVELTHVRCAGEYRKFYNYLSCNGLGPCTRSDACSKFIAQLGANAPPFFILFGELCK